MFELESNRRRIVGQALYFGLWLAITAVAIALRPSSAGHGTHTELGLPPCPSVLLFGRPCPGCGLTTSWTALVHGDFALSFSAHPFGPILYGLFTATAFLALWGWIRSRRFRFDGPRAYRAMIALAIAYFGFGIWRMATHPNYRSAIDFAASVRTPR